MTMYLNAENKNTTLRSAEQGGAARAPVGYLDKDGLAYKIVVGTWIDPTLDVKWIYDDNELELGLARNAEIAAQRRATLVSAAKENVPKVDLPVASAFSVSNGFGVAA